MTKRNLIKAIEEYDGGLVWEIDDEKYYGLIGWDGGDNSYWLVHNMEVTNNQVLSDLLNELKKF